MPDFTWKYASPSAVGSGDGSIGNPWTAHQAMSNAVAGDAVFFRGGIYDLYYDLVAYSTDFYDDRGILFPANTGTAGAPIMFARYPGEIAILNANTDAGYSTTDARAFGSGTSDYIYFNGFVVQADGGAARGGVGFKGNALGRKTLGHRIFNCHFRGGGVATASTDNRDGIRMEQTIDTHVRNCSFTGYRQINDSLNTAAIKMYDNDAAIIEHCDVGNCSGTIFLKANNSDCIVRNNYIHDSHGGILSQIVAGVNSPRQRIHNNVLVNLTGAPLGCSQQGTGNLAGWHIYDNTMYNVAGNVGYARGDSSIYNNILYVNSGWTYAGNVDAELLVSDYNNWGVAPYVIIQDLNDPSQVVYTSLIAWQESGGMKDGSNPDLNSIAADPIFTNGSGLFNQLSDFTLDAGSPCIGTGLAGTNMGADIATVGLLRPGIDDLSVAVFNDDVAMSYELSLGPLQSIDSTVPISNLTVTYSQQLALDELTANDRSDDLVIALINKILGQVLNPSIISIASRYRA